MNRRGFKLATVFGMPIRVHSTWFVVFALITLTLATLIFPEQPGAKGLGQAWYWTMGVATALLLFVSVLLHELGHSLAAKHHSIPVEGITLFLFGGVAQIGEEPRSPRVEAEVTVAGWVVTAVIALFCFLLWPVLPAGAPGWQALRSVVSYLGRINVMLLVFNAIPGFPLDGGRLLRAFIWWTTGNLRKATYIASSVGAGVGLALIIGGVGVVLLGSWGGAWMALIGFFLRGAAQSSYQQLLVRRALEGVPLSEIMSADVVCIAGETTLEDAVNDWFLRYRYDAFPVCGPQGLRGMLTLDNVRAVPRARWPETTVEQAMDGRAPEYASPPDMDAVRVLARMSQYDVGRIPVVEAGLLVGIVTRRDILKVLRLKTDLEELQ